MKNLVTIKSFKNGLSIILDNAADFTDLRQAMADKFKEASGFFKEFHLKTEHFPKKKKKPCFMKSTKTVRWKCFA